MEAGESKVIPCPDPRCALSFDSIQDLQCHCQDVHCVERIKLDPIEKRRLTRQFSLNVKAFGASSSSTVMTSWTGKVLTSMSIKQLTRQCSSHSTLSFVLEQVRLEDKTSLSQSYSLPSIDLAANQEKRNSSAASFTGSESPLSSIDTRPHSLTRAPASSVNSDLPLLFDPRLLNESISQPAIPPS